MTSLSEAYRRRVTAVSRQRLYLGIGLFGSGALLLVAGILAGTTTLAINAGLDVGGARELAGVLAGLGFPAVLIGVFVVLPATTRQRAAAAVGAGITVLGVTLFRFTYPGRWYVGGSEGIPTTLTLLTTVTYFLGTVITLWGLFAAVATFKRRNDPGGTVTLTVTRGGETETVEVAAEDAATAREAFGGVGVMGIDDEAVPTQTGPGTAAGASDGGSSVDDINTPGRDAELLGEETEESAEPPTDSYCGNCAHFDYVETDDGIEPYCGAHDELMDDMEPCEKWSPRTGDGDVARLD